MFNIYDFVRNEAPCRKLICEDLVFVEYKCMPELANFNIWSQFNYFGYVVSGKKIYKTPEGEWQAEKGEALFCKKGATHIKNFIEDDFCSLIFFMSDDFIREVVQEYYSFQPGRSIMPIDDAQVFDVHVDVTLRTYCDSVAGYFFQNQPSEEILRLKFKELILNLISSDVNLKLTSYFLSLVNEKEVNLRQIMEKNCLFNLSLNDYAQLCSRSIASFKRDFKTTYGMPPGKWVANKRLNYAKMLLESTNMTAKEIAYKSGFEDTSPFFRSFKRKFNATPQEYRLQINQSLSA